MLTALTLSLCPLLSGDVVLPEGPAARAWASVDPDATVSDAWMEALGEDAAEVLSHSDPWSAPKTWHAWSRWLKSKERSPKESGALAYLAARGGRSADAWAHFATLVREPEVAASLMPKLLPGLPGELQVDAAVPRGALLTPIPPPGALDAARGVVGPISASTTFRAGEAEVRLVISVERAGVEVKVHHLSGGSASFLVQLPELPAREVRITYIDWMRQETRNDPLLVELHPEKEGPVQLFGRFMPRDEHLPALPEGRLPTQLLEAGLWFELAAEGAPTPLQRAAAEAITDCLGVPGGVRAAGQGGAGAPSAGTVISLGGGQAGARTLSRIAGATEAWLNSR